MYINYQLLNEWFGRKVCKCRLDFLQYFHWGLKWVWVIDQSNMITWTDFLLEKGNLAHEIPLCLLHSNTVYFSCTDVSSDCGSTSETKRSKGKLTSPFALCDFPFQSHKKRPCLFNLGSWCLDFLFICIL